MLRLDMFNGLAPGEFHRLERRVWPPRMVVRNTSVGWNECMHCGREHRIWMTTNYVWRLLPRGTRRLRICVMCFRVAIGNAYIAGLPRTTGVRDQLEAMRRRLA